MLCVVNEVQHEVVLHGDIEGLHLLSLSTGLGNSSFDSILSLHELVVLGLDIIDNAWGVDRVTVAIPVDLLNSTCLLRFVVVVEDA